MRKRIFWTSGKEKLSKRMEHMEKEFRRVNTLEVHIKRLLKLEGDLSALRYDNKVEKGGEKAFFRKSDGKNDQLLFKRIEAILHTKMELQDKEFRKMNEKLITLERRLSETETQLQKEQLQNKQLMKQMEHLNRKVEDQTSLDKQPVVFQEINVDHMMIDKYELYNNIAQLGVKDLSGSLNIGPTYGKGILPDELTEDLKEKFDEMKDKVNEKKSQDVSDQEE
ncbi:hypothetical protein M3936_22645 [Sutcliffiella horikoshii]|uniref:hypothetical protein n=1 Tax=Sutcliffiella horikoshii TaxID=79883 RepID=UPI00203C58CA|nr:hypothetical protein [Sutcliffiella horikoshii]MCM3620359.1 hypothetical protein [Sutcliffiella horikoshii]